MVSVENPHTISLSDSTHSHRPAGTMNVTLTCRVDIFSRADAAGITADSPAFQQGTEGPRLTLWRGTSKTLGTAQSVDPTRFSNAHGGGV